MISDQIYRFLLKVYPPMEDLPAILFIRRPSGGLEGLSAVFLDDLSADFMAGCFR